MEKIKSFISSNWLFITAVLFLVSSLSFEFEYRLYGINILPYLEPSEIGLYSLRTIIQSFLIFLVAITIGLLPVFYDAILKRKSQDKTTITINLMGISIFIIDIIVLISCFSESEKFNSDKLNTKLIYYITISQSIYLLFFVFFQRFRNSLYITFLNLAVAIYFINISDSIIRYNYIQTKCNRSTKLITKDGDIVFPYCNTYIAGITQKYVFLNNDIINNSASIPILNVKSIIQYVSSNTSRSFTENSYYFLINLFKNRPNPVGENYYVIVTDAGTNTGSGVGTNTGSLGGIDPGDGDGGLDPGDATHYSTNEKRTGKPLPVSPPTTRPVGPDTKTNKPNANPTPNPNPNIADCVCKSEYFR